MAFLVGKIEDIKERISENRERYQRAGAIAGSFLLGSSVLGAYKATVDANNMTKAREAATAAASEIAMKPYMSSSNIGAAGEIQISEGLKSWLPLGLVFIVVMYIMFKD